MAKKQTVKKVKRSKRQPNVEFTVNGCLVTMTYSEWEKKCQRWKEKQFVFHKDYLEDVQYVLSQSYGFSGTSYEENFEIFVDLKIEYVGYSIIRLSDICPYIMIKNYIGTDTHTSKIVVVEKNAKVVLRIAEESKYMASSYEDALQKMLEYYRNDIDKRYVLPKQEVKFEQIDDYVVMTFTKLRSVDREIKSTDYCYLFHKDYADELKDLQYMNTGNKYKENSKHTKHGRPLTRTSVGFAFRKNDISKLQNLKDICNYIALTEDGYVVVAKGDYESFDIDEYSKSFDNLDDALEMLKSL